MDQETDRPRKANTPLDTPVRVEVPLETLVGDDELGHVELPSEDLTAGEALPAARPMSEITGRHDDGSDANETIDGLNPSDEAVRHAAEDVPSSERPPKVDDIPVFDRGDMLPKV